MEPTYLLATLPLFVAPLSLLVAALVLALLPTRHQRPAALVAAGSVLVAALVLVAAAPAALGGSVVIDPALRMFRSGSLDVLLGCVLDKVSLVAAFATLVSAGGFVAAAAAKKLPQRQLSLALAIAGGALTAALAEGFPTLLFGLSLTFWLGHLARESEAPLRVRSLAFVAGIVSTVFAVAFMFWSLGGQWLDNARYLGDFRARFAVTSAQAEATKRASGAAIGQGKLTILSHPGSRVYLGVVDQGQLKRSEPVGVTPLVRQPIPAGLQKIAIEPGGSAIVGGEGVEVALIDTVEVREDVETVISLVGPTVTFHELAPTLRAGTFASRRVGQSSAGVVIGALLCFSVCAFLLAFAERPRGVASVFARACLLVAVGVLFSRLGPLASSSPGFAMGGVVLLAAFAVWSVARGAGPWFAAAALLGGAAFAGAPLAATVIAAAIAPGLFALAELESAPRVAPAQATTRAATKTKKKRKNERASVPAPAAKTGETTLPLTLTRLALGLAPVPLLGAFAGIGSAIATPFSSSFGRGLVFWLALALIWAAFAWSLQQALHRLAGAELEAPLLRRVSVLAGIAALSGPVFAIVVRPWYVAPAFGATLAAIVAVAAGALVLITAPLATRHAPPPPEPTAPAESLLPRVDALLEKLDLLFGLPLSLVQRWFSRAEKEEPS